MDVDGIVRATRRQQALDALDFERDRETAVLEQIGEVLTELEGPRIDETAFARMAPEDVTLVRGVLDPNSDEPDEGAELDELGSPELQAEIRAEQKAERVRLEGVLADSRSRQQALERYLAALDEMRGAPEPAQSLPD